MYRSHLAGILLAALIGTVPAGAAETVLDDFDTVPLSQTWSAYGPVEADWVAVGDAQGGAAGLALHIRSKGRSAVASKPGALPLAQFGRAEQVSFWARSGSGGAQPAVLEVLGVETDQRASFWRKVEIPADGWHEVRLPLAWFRWERGRVPDWSRVTSLAFRLRGVEDIWIDRLAICDNDPLRGANVTLEELRAFAFGGLPGRARSKDTGVYWLLTNAESLDLDQLSGHMDQVLAALRADLRLPAKPCRPAVLLVFSDHASYRDFAVRFARRLNAEVEPPKFHGFNLQGLAMSSWDEDQGTLDPVFTHEFTHSMLSVFAGLDPSATPWLQEGVAHLCQIRFHPEPSQAAIIAEGLANPRLRFDLRTLCSAESLPLDRYWQAASLVDTLFRAERFRGKVPAMLEAMRRSGSSQLEPLLGPVFGSNWEELDAAWRQHARRMAAEIARGQ